VRRKGRPIAHGTFGAAALARELIDRYGVGPMEACRAAADAMREQMGAGEDLKASAVEREYRKIRDSPDVSKVTKRTGEKIVSALLSDDLVAYALARLSASTRARLERQESGNN
jgi:hypothetical protein